MHLILRRHLLFSMPFRSFWGFTAATLLGCFLLICFFDQPLAWLFHRHGAPLTPFFAAVTAAWDRGYAALIRVQLGGWPAFFVALAGAFAVIRVGLRRPWGNVFLLLLLVHPLSIISANVLKGLVHRLRPEALFQAGYAGLGFWQSGPLSDSFPSGHTATCWSLFWPLAMCWPRFRGPLLVLPGLIGLGRLFLGVHYVSDVWFSVWLVAAWTCLLGWVGSQAIRIQGLVLSK
jgi:membrane-associated phospholipid phosphatase